MKIAEQAAANTDFEVKLKEDDDYLYLFYRDTETDYCLIYDKNKDLCEVLKNGKMAQLKAFTDQETERYKEVLDIAITYHHDRTIEHFN